MLYTMHCTNPAFGCQILINFLSCLVLNEVNCISSRRQLANCSTRGVGRQKSSCHWKCCAIRGARDQKFSDLVRSGFWSVFETGQIQIQPDSSKVVFNVYFLLFCWNVFFVGDRYSVLYCLCKLLRCRLTKWNKDFCCDVWLYFVFIISS